MRGRDIRRSPSLARTSIASSNSSAGRSRRKARADRARRHAVDPPSLGWHDADARLFVPYAKLPIGSHRVRCRRRRLRAQLGPRRWSGWCSGRSCSKQRSRHSGDSPRSGIRRLGSAPIVRRYRRASPAAREPIGESRPAYGQARSRRAVFRRIRRGWRWPASRPMTRLDSSRLNLEAHNLAGKETRRPVTGLSC